MAHKLIYGQSSLSFVLVTYVIFHLCTGIDGNNKVYKFVESQNGNILRHNVSNLTEEWIYFCFDGLTKYVTRLWSDPVIKVQFVNSREPKQYRKITGVNKEDLDHQRSRISPFVWLKGLLVGYAGETSFAAFNKSCIGIQTDEPYTTRFVIKTVNLWFIAYLSLGILIFLSAKSWCHNTALHYGTGISVGVIASIVILLIVLHRVFPQSLRRIGYLMIALASSTSLFLWTHIYNLLQQPITDSVYQYWHYILGYVVVTGLISFAICYKYGPITDTRSLNLIQWLIQGVGLVLVYNGTQIRELSVALIIILLTLYNIPGGLFRNRYLYYMKYRFFPPKHRFLTEEEYIRKGHEETAKALEDLRNYCCSPECDTWKIVSRLKSPQRFADFVEGNSWHVTDEELLEYDSGPDPTPPTDHDLDDEDIDFVLDSVL